ncbi:hypothetical protein AGMMS50267_05950 [Spirochaetia bacterium]|nr:hypothetical protein AGMMS50267_05950 [Spirochaetia bacterium]
MYPFSFDEFLRALGDGMLADAYRTASPYTPLSEPVHSRLLNQLKLFFIVGGMPEAVAEYVKTGDLLQSGRVLNDLLTAFKADFAKYRKKIPALLLNEVFESVVHQAGEKFVYERAAVGSNHAQVKQALELLLMAGLAHPVTHTAANGLPLGAEINLKHRWIIPCDTGLFLHILGLGTGAGNPAAEVLLADDVKLINRGALAEIFVGLELLKAASCYTPRQLYCWHRAVTPGEKRQSNAQVDYLIQRGEKIIPIAVKAGTQGAMQGLRIFMADKKIDTGLRTSMENFGAYGDIAVYPLYAIGNLGIIE